MISLADLADRVDTQFENAQGDYRALVVMNPTDEAYTGFALLRVRMPLKPSALSLEGTPPTPKPSQRIAGIWDEQGNPIPCQIVNSHLELATEFVLPDGTKRPLPEGSHIWQFELWFWVEQVPARGYRVYRSEWVSEEIP
ncbi:MAG: hypothetical protein SNJ72_07200, partial [Fimbriimonadales bacterium]